jgi:hypothetical protein
MGKLDQMDYLGDISFSAAMLSSCGLSYTIDLFH